MSVPFNRFNSLEDAAFNKKLNLAADALFWMLTNTLPVAANAVKTDITEIAAGNGYAAGGTQMAASGYTSVTGTGKLTGNITTFTASAGSMATFRYAVIYDNTATNKDLIGWYDYGSAISLAVGETFSIGSAIGGNFDATNPLLIVTQP